MTYLKVSAFKIFNFSVLFGFCFLSIANANDNLLDHTKKINFLLSEFHTKNKVALNPKADDTVFVRRAYLNIIGRIPTAAESTQYIESNEQNKKSKLISKLINSEGYVSHQYNWWADILRVNTRMQGQSPTNGMAYSNWIKNSIEKIKVMIILLET